jgi:AcrR family transcriptional regulator
MSIEDSLEQDFHPSKVPDERPGPEGGRRHTNRLARTRTLVEAALRCFLTLVLDAVTIDDVTKEAGVAKGSFYRYFDNKEDLIATLFRPTAEAVEAAMTRASESLESAADEPALEAAYALLATDLALVLFSNEDAVRLFLQERHGPATVGRAPIRALDERVLALALRITQAGRRSGLLRPVDPEVSASAVVGAVMQLLWIQLVQAPPSDPISRARELIDIVLHGVRA